MASIPLLRLSMHLYPKTLTKPDNPHTTLSLIAARLHHPLKPKLNVPPVKRSPQFLRRSGSSTISMSHNTVPATDRLISAVSYCLPFFNGLQYGRFLLSQYPTLSLFFEPVLPLLNLYRSIPYASFVAFFALYLGIVRNPNLSRYVRFNSMQALVLDVLLVVPLLAQRILMGSSGRPGGLGFKLMVMGHNALFVFIVFCFLYSLGYCVLGRTPYLPFVADAAGRQL
ncbi:Chloroplast protein import component Tic20 [Dillenia turbinata]|uniref:Protein TIC 20 n=1 Tax=Dillenia turbinata TaxID=194707 RepID=A0AAN8YW11_9MAGN